MGCWDATAKQSIAAHPDLAIWDFGFGGKPGRFLGPEMVIATELITQVRKNVSMRRTLRESARARIRVIVKRILNKYGYPPDLQESAVKQVLMQAELICGEIYS